MTCILASWGRSDELKLLDQVRQVTGRAEYKHARWGILAVDATDEKVLFEQNADQLFIPASTTKLYTCSAALGELGPDFRFQTKLVSTGSILEGTLVGDLILVASGDLTLGGRTKADGTMAYCNGDHTYADSTSTTAAVTDTDPLAGLKDLAAQVKAAGIDRIRGDVLIDDRLFDPARSSGSGPEQVRAIVLNDNVIDFVLTVVDARAHVELRPPTAYLTVDNQVRVGPVDRPNVQVVIEGPRRVSLRGTIPAKGGPVVRIWPVDDPAAFARCALIECLRRQGVEVASSPIGEPRAPLPERATVAGAKVFATHTSAPLSEATKVTLKVSHNLYASTLPLLIAAKHGERTLTQGLIREGRFLKTLGVDTDAVAFAGGAGGALADSTSPRATVQLLRKMRSRPEYAAFEAGLPVLGVDGTLATVVAADSPAKGRVRGKTGTLHWADLLNQRALLRSKALAGTMSTRSGRDVIFAMYVNDVPLPAGMTPEREGKALGKLCEILFDALP